ncbi:hypothetical protein [Streptomyces yanii]|uniref:Uncharacterized protein n=1 Tax=Streptomyces yanii TaxID=78510 RepID=A0ABV5RFB0_9ACTN
MDLEQQVLQVDPGKHRLGSGLQPGQRLRLAHRAELVHRQAGPASAPGDDNLRFRPIAGLLQAIGHLPPRRIQTPHEPGQVLAGVLGQGQARQNVRAHRLPPGPRERGQAVHRSARVCTPQRDQIAVVIVDRQQRLERRPRLVRRIMP